jgi:hypothetical protein
VRRRDYATEGVFTSRQQYIGKKVQDGQEGKVRRGDYTIEGVFTSRRRDIGKKIIIQKG